MAEKTRYTVIGAGHGGKTMAAHLALMGIPTTLYNRTADHIYAIKELGGIELDNPEGDHHGFGKLERVIPEHGEVPLSHESDATHHQRKNEQPLHGGVLLCGPHAAP